jgi:hypothetical protein
MLSWMVRKSFLNNHPHCSQRFVLLGVERVREKTRQVSDDIGDQKRWLFCTLMSLAMDVDLLSQGIKYAGISAIGSPPQIHLSISTLQAVLATKAPPYGSPKAIHSWTGKHLGHCYGSTENVQSPSFYSFALTNGFPSPQQDPERVSLGSSLP